MGLLEIKITDRFYEIGNAVFNVQGVSYIGNCELAYESNDDIIINRVFYTAENRTQELLKKLWIVLMGFYNIFIQKKDIGKETLSDIKKRSLSIINKKSNNDANAVIHNNVRNRLLKTINQDIENYKMKNTKVIKPKPKYKNQMQFTENKTDSQNVFSENNFRHLLQSARQSLIKTIFK